jgi:3-oxoadipate enol-lactonase
MSETITVDSSGCPIHVQIEGPADAPALMLSNSLGTTLEMWDDQIPAFTRHFRVIRYDRRGHGRSGASAGAYTMEQLGQDVLAILDRLGIGKTNWCGLSMGGMVGMWLGAKAADRLERVVLANTGAYYADKQPWNDRMKAVEARGMGAVAEGTMERWFTKPFREREGAKVERFKEMVMATPVQGYVGCCAAVRDMDHRELLPQCSAPTLIIAGRQDPATTLQMAEDLHANIKGSQLGILEAAHISNVEQPEAFAHCVLSHLRRS